MVVNNDDATKQLFSRCLLNCLQIPLWRCYIRFIRKVNEKKGIEGQEETRNAFDFMLSYVGADIASGPVWMEYISFLKSLPAQTPQEESQRMTAVRKVYQKAIITPTRHVEQLWREYENFENSVSRALAKGLLSEYQPKYNSARAVYRERKKYVDEIDWNMLAVPPSGAYKNVTCRSPPTGRTAMGCMEKVFSIRKGVPAPSTSDLSGSSKSHLVHSSSSFKPARDRQPGKRKNLDRQDDDDTATVQSQPLPKDVFKIRQLRKARATGSQTGSASYGSTFSGELSGSTG